MTDSEIIVLLQCMVYDHFKKQEDTVREFKHITKIPQSGDEYVKNINVWELQDKAIKRMDEERREVINFLNNILKKDK